MRRSDDEQLGFTFSLPTPLEPALPQAPPEPAASVRKVWTIRELVSTIRGRMEREFSDVWFEGEMSNYRPAPSGHMYFTIKDGDAQIRIVMFRSAARLLRFKPDNGMLLIGRGRVTVYEDRGELQIVADYLEPKGAGALQVAFEQLKAKLAAEGLFDVARKRPIPRLPRAVGIVTSPRGAAIQDILNILRRRHEDVNVLIFPAQVQGESAAMEVAYGIRYFNKNKNVDVIIVARGGGSIEDLAAFNDEMLARTIAASELPVISAVGHEIDFTIADFVADLRAPTPSAAAELVIEAKHQLESAVVNLGDRLRNAMRYRLILAKQRLEQLGQYATFERIRSGVQRRQQRVDELVFRVATAERVRLQQMRQRLDTAEAHVRHHDLRRGLAANRNQILQQEQRIASAMQRGLFERRARLDRLETQLKALSPLSVLERGYSLAFDSEGRLVRSVEQVHKDSILTTRVADGEITSTVLNLHKTVRE
jgi:exodeoxyribonuclease VII large subunit